MSGDELYKKAMSEMDDLANDVIEQCVDFADSSDYEKEWVLDRFQEQFSKAKAKYLNQQTESLKEGKEND